MFVPGIGSEKGVSICSIFNIWKGCEIWLIGQWEPDTWKQGTEEQKKKGSEMTVLLTATHITGLCERETSMSVQYAINRTFFFNFARFKT